jgi:hypothetical protein
MYFDRTTGVFTLRFKFKMEHNRTWYTDICAITRSDEDVLTCKRESEKFVVFYKDDEYLLGFSEPTSLENTIEMIVCRNFFQISLNDNHWIKFQNIPSTTPSLYPPNTFLKDGHPNLHENDYKLEHNQTLNTVFISLTFDYE